MSQRCPCCKKVFVGVGLHHHYTMNKTGCSPPKKQKPCAQNQTSFNTVGIQNKLMNKGNSDVLASFNSKEGLLHKFFDSRSKQFFIVGPIYNGVCCDGTLLDSSIAISSNMNQKNFSE